jgi:hypothetical protein
MNYILDNEDEDEEKICPFTLDGYGEQGLTMGLTGKVGSEQFYRKGTPPPPPVTRDTHVDRYVEYHQHSP